MFLFWCAFFWACSLLYVHYEFVFGLFFVHRPCGVVNLFIDVETAVTPSATSEPT